MGTPLRLTVGAARLARLTGAVLVPACVSLGQGIDIRFGTAVPQESIEGGCTRTVNEFLVKQWWKDLSHDPCAIGWTTLEAYAPEHLVRNRTRWP